MTALATLRDVGFEEWLGKINTACGRFCAKTLGPGFSGAMQEFRAHALRLSVVDVSQARLYRTPREIARSDGAHFTVFQLRGSALMEQGESQTVLSRRHHADRRLTAQQLHLPARFAPNLVAVAARLPAGAAALCPASRSRAQRGAPQPPTGAEQHAGSSARRGGKRGGAECAGGAAAPALALELARPEGQQPVFDKALALIDRHIQSAQLRPEWVAAELGCRCAACIGCSPAGLVVAQYIRNRRLDLCAQALRSAAGQEKLAGVGLDWGFADHSHFSTAFKQRFGMSPSEYRRQYQ